jgi:hypothetical protein
VGHASGSLATWKDGGCWVRAGELGAAELNSVLRPQIGISCGWLLALLDEAESFIISHMRQGQRILLFLFGNS